MLGRTNLLFTEDKTDLTFSLEYILTPSSNNIIKVENINGLFFVFASDEKVYYGSDAESLKVLKNGSNYMTAKHIIYADGVYYISTIEKTVGKAIIYKTQDLSTFEEVTLKNGSSSYSYPVHGLFLSSGGQIVALITEEKTSMSTSENYLKFVLIVDSLNNYNANTAQFIEISSWGYIAERTATYTKMRKDRILTTFNKPTIINLDGGVAVVQSYESCFYAANYFFAVDVANTGKYNNLYYSLNGQQYTKINFADVLPKIEVIEIFEYDGNIAMYYKDGANTSLPPKVAISTTPNGLVQAVEDGIPLKMDFTMQKYAVLYKDEYVYIGCATGVIVKAKIENYNPLRPDIAVLKTLAAKQALKEANEYTERLFAALETRIEALEEAAN